MAEHSTLTERLTREILATIRSEGLEPGSALPPARTLAERFSVTVPTVREALRRLEATDAIELRHGSGTYVGASIDRRILAGPYYDPADLRAAIELLDARIAVEPGIARLAATARTDEALAALETSIDNALRVEGTGVTDHFHVHLASASGNRVLRETVESLLVIHERGRHLARVRYDRVQDHAEHVDIVDAVRRGDANEAAWRTERHLTSLRDSLVAGGEA